MDELVRQRIKYLVEFGELADAARQPRRPAVRPGLVGVLLALNFVSLWLVLLTR